MIKTIFLVDDKDGLLYQLHKGRKRLFVPLNFREKILSSFHDFGHFGFNKLYENVSYNYFWSGMKSDIRNWIASCLKCGLEKKIGNKYGNNGLLNPIEY